jgi:acyl carrier protein
MGFGSPVGRVVFRGRVAGVSVGGAASVDRAEIFERLRVQMAKNLEIDVEDIEVGSRLVDDLDADSLDLLELVLSLKGEFGIAVNDGEVKQLLTELARFLPDGARVGGQLSDQELAEVSRRLSVANVVEFIADRVGSGG